MHANYTLLRLLPAVLSMLLLAACATLPQEVVRPPSQVITDTTHTRLGRSAATLATGQPAGFSGIHPLPDPVDAFVARMLLARTAERTLDVQYYIWRHDHTGMLMFEALWEAAERGVRVRLLLDDNNTADLDDTLAALDAHDGIEVRLYNPLAMRSTRLLNYVGEFGRLNRRMHNKSMTGDNQATIVGGRNIGNEYFDAGHGVGFEDLDVLAMGPVVGDVSTSFDAYWNSPSAYPFGSIVPMAADRDALLAGFKDVRAQPEAQGYLQRMRENALLHAVLNGSRADLEWARTRLVVDPPGKTLGETPANEPLLLRQLFDVTGTPGRAFDVVTPYFVPGPEGTKAFAALAQRQVQVRVLTNSLASTDVSAVHAGYAKRREALLRAGVQLYELKPQAEAKYRRAAGGGGSSGGSGSSSASLHAKTFAQDGERAFVGSFNFDPRSAHLNTELGLVIDSPKLANAIHRWFDTQASTHAYQVLLTDDDDLRWIEQTPAGRVQHDTEPGSSALRRGWVEFLSILPIEWLL